MGSQRISDASPKLSRYKNALAIGLLFVLFDAGARLSGQDKRTYYTVQHPEQFAIDWTAFYTRAEALTDATRHVVTNHLDLSYGDHPKQKLDVYEAAPRREASPVFIFLHGGGFREGDRRQYGYVARPLAPAGIVAALPAFPPLPGPQPSPAPGTRTAPSWVDPPHPP